MFTPTKRLPEALIFFAISVALSGILVSCEDTIAEMDDNSQIELRMDNGKAMSVPGSAHLLVSGLQGAAGSTVGPGGALYVTEGAVGRISRIEPKTSEVTTFTSGLPLSIIGIGGVQDVAFLGGTAYAIVTLVGPQFGTSDIVGIYRIDGPDSYTIIADIGEFSLANPPNTSFFVDMGVQYAIQTYRGGFLVADGHHLSV